MDSIIDSLIELINAAQRISDGGFDIKAFLTWKSRSVHYSGQPTRTI